MKVSFDKVNCFFRQFTFSQGISRRSLNLISLLCWVLPIIIGTFLIAVGTSNNERQFSACPDSKSFCSYSLPVTSSTTLYFYFLYESFNQNNRNFLDAYSEDQLRGNIGDTTHCSTFYTYAALNLTQNVGGYRVPATAHLHPCGEVMKNVADDVVYLVDSQGATPSLNNGDLVSEYNLNSHFIRLSDYQLTQWIDVRSAQFVNYFTVPLTTTKYSLVGKTTVTPGDYNIVMQNNFKTNGAFSKKLVVSQIGTLGATNHFLGFAYFIFGVILLFAHIVICFKWRT